MSSKLGKANVQGTLTKQHEIEPVYLIKRIMEEKLELRFRDMAVLDVMSPVVKISKLFFLMKELRVI